MIAATARPGLRQSALTERPVGREAISTPPLPLTARISDAMAFTTSTTSKLRSVNSIPPNRLSPFSQPSLRDRQNSVLASLVMTLDVAQQQVGARNEIGLQAAVSPWLQFRDFAQALEFELIHLCA